MARHLRALTALICAGALLAYAAHPRPRPTHQITLSICWPYWLRLPWTLTMAQPLSKDAIAKIAAEYHVPEAALRAVIHVEAPKGGFLPDGRVRILFERHILWERLRERGIDPRPLAAVHPELCGAVWNKQRYPYGTEAAQWAKVGQVCDWAQKNQPDRFASYRKAVLESCSWGLFQVLGCNYDLAGYPDVVQFKAAMETGEDAQLRAGLSFMDHKGLIPFLRAKDWRRFTLGYNGDGQVDDYAHWLASAYARFV